MIKQHLKRTPLVAPIARYAYRWLTLPSRVLEVRQMLEKLASREPITQPPRQAAQKPVESVAPATGHGDPPGEFHWSIRHRDESPPGAPRHVGLTSKLCQSVDFDQPLYHYWCGSIRENPVYHRKQWEFFFIAQALWERGLLAEGRSGVGFGVGQEPLPALFASMGCRVLATDLEKDLAAAAGWATTRQYAEDIRLLNKRGICDPKLFHARVSVRCVNMNEIPADLGEFDFCWSSCSLEHLGSIKHGQRFIENSLDCLKPGGLAVHTTEYNISSNDQTVETGPTVLFRKRDIEEIVGRVTAAGHTVEPVSFDPGSEPVDKYLDLPPYRYEPHLKLWFDGFTTTSIALIIRKAQGES